MNSLSPRVVQLTEANSFLKEHPEIQYVDLLITDMNGVVRGKRVERASLSKVYERGINLPASLFALDINGSTVESTGLGLHIGDADRTCFPIPGTLSPEPWQKRPTAQLLMTMHELDGSPFFADPREVLRRVVQKFDDLGLTLCAAFELEFYLIDQENVNGRPQPPRSPISGKRPVSTQVYLIDDLDEYVDCLQDMLEAAKEQGLPADAIVKESAPAQFEVNLHHVEDAIKACDHAVLLKRLIKNIAYDHEMDSTFMAKPYPGQAGNGLHVHISLLDKATGQNIFASDDPEHHGPLRHAIAGILDTLPASMAFLCPNVNSYRRFGAQFYVPNAPSWGLDNRTVAVRVPTGNSEAIRIEHRVAGADANPYLMLASILAGIHHGLTQQLDPGAPVSGNSYEQLEQSLPNNLRDALRELDDSPVMNQYISPEYIDIFVACKEAELEEFETTISDLEYNWYLHTV
ncbi:glutamine synthetase family protein [Pseudomonas sp. EpS/L25]|uniref:glutamine synthetase family protein n=1 Tax=Pseudomonas sp. EpS/L25 TaxID=1749078 RepID=UPI00074324E2|nr:glutamine synthetase family protein [Pseudomonas sp. EpS/L25]KUM44707.1 gamma-glutamylputrescine synthetase [Pseudomonas sp. EpS/L25]